MVLQYAMMWEVESIECGAGMALGSLTAKLVKCSTFPSSGNAYTCRMGISPSSIASPKKRAQSSSGVRENVGFVWTDRMTRSLDHTGATTRWGGAQV